MSATQVILVRHTEPEAAARGRCYGRLDVDLSDAGRRHAEGLGTALASFGVGALFSSPQRRALETARFIGARLDLEPTEHPELAEIDFGEFEGRRYEEIAASEPALYRAWMDTPTAVRFPGGESFTDLRARVLPAVAEIRAAHAGSVVVLVAHGGVIRAVLAAALALPDDEIFGLPQDYGGVSIVDFSAAGAAVRAVNADLILTAS